MSAVMERLAERREFQRLELMPPIPATLGNVAVSILEIGVLGARVHHGAPLDAQKTELRFWYRDHEIVMRCELVRTNERKDKYRGTGYESGLRFIAAIGESGDRLRDMLSELVTAELERRRDLSMRGIGPAVDGDRTVRGKDAGYLTYRFDGHGWSRHRVFLPEQPPMGFTVARMTDSEEMKRLCAVYEASDEEGRRLIRLFAELSISDALQIPPVA
jgi:hypothetical protein